MDPSNDLIGIGWHFPVCLDGVGGIRLASGTDDIVQAIYLIVGTPIGYRLMRPQFGCRIHELIFAPMNATTFTAACHYVEEALGMWEPRIDVTDVRCAPDREVEGGMLISIKYRVRATHDERSLVYPFYTIPPEL